MVFERTNRVVRIDKLELENDNDYHYRLNLIQFYNVYKPSDDKTNQFQIGQQINKRRCICLAFLYV
jgi:hypothetical protein